MFNPMERIRKLSGMPSMRNGCPPVGHRKCSDWASYTDAVDTVSRELVAQLLQCQTSALDIATDKAALAGKLAVHEELHAKTDKARSLAATDRVLIEADTSKEIREEVSVAITG